MKKFVLLLTVLLFLGCSSIDYPRGFVVTIKFNSDILDLEKMQIKSKEELFEFIDTIYNEYYWRSGGISYPKYGLEVIAHDLEYTTPDSDYEYVVYVDPLSNKKPVLNKNIYELGMPIAIIKDYDVYIRYSEQPIILIKGKSEWADSSYKGYTILPVSESGEENNLDFNYTIKKVKISKEGELL